LDRGVKLGGHRLFNRGLGRETGVTDDRRAAPVPAPEIVRPPCFIPWSWECPTSEIGAALHIGCPGLIKSRQPSRYTYHHCGDIGHRMECPMVCNKIPV